MANSWFHIDMEHVVYWHIPEKWTGVNGGDHIDHDDQDPVPVPRGQTHRETM